MPKKRHAGSLLKNNNSSKWRQKQEHVEVQMSPQECCGAEKNLRPYTLQDAVRQCKVPSTFWIMCLGGQQSTEQILASFTAFHMQQKHNYQCEQAFRNHSNHYHYISFSDRFALDGCY